MGVSTWTWPASTLLKVIDGDTLDVLVHRDLGFGGVARLPVRLRLARINAPAASTVQGAAAGAYLASLLPPTFDLTTLKPYKYGGVADRMGEWMAEITLPDGRNVSDVMVATGHAVAWDGAGPRPGG